MSRQLKIGLLLGFIALATIFTATVSSATVSSAQPTAVPATELADVEAEIVASLEANVAKKLQQLQNR